MGHHCNVSLRCLQNHIPLQKRSILQIPFMMEIRKMQSSSVKKNYFAIPCFYISDALLQIDLLSICVFVRRACLIAPNNIYRVGVKFTAHIPTDFKLHSFVHGLCKIVPRGIFPFACRQFIESVEKLHWLSCFWNGIAQVSECHFGQMFKMLHIFLAHHLYFTFS